MPRVLHLGLLVGIAGGAEDDQFSLPVRLAQLLAQDPRGVRLDDNAGLEVAPGVVAEVLMSAAREAVDAGVLAAAIGIDAPAEPEPGRVRVVNNCLALDFLERDPGSHASPSAVAR
jgi:hypothetical protein